jgi:CheY-like chemotaxis protein
MIRDPALPPEQVTRVEPINRAGEHLLSLINGILEMSKIEAGQITFNESVFDLHGLLDNLIEIYGVSARNKGVTLTLKRADEVPRYIASDEAKLRQALLNLIGNAVKFTADGSIVVSATARKTDAKTVSLCFSIADTGPGISDKDLKLLFKPFVQSSAGVSLGGTGLGLAISRQYARLLGGDITVKSQLGDGATFTLTVLAKIAAEAPATVPIEAPRVLRLANGQPSVRILVVDDIPLNRELLAAIMTPMGFELKLAENGAEALEITKAWKPQAIIMDMEMPVMNGYEANRRIKAEPESRDIYILALSASAFEEDKAAVLASGADMFMRKPFKQDELLTVLGKRLHLRYEYADTSATEKPSALAPTGNISRIPEAMCADLLNACSTADYEKLVQICDGLAASAPAAAKELRGHVDAFEYDAIVRLATRSSEAFALSKSNSDHRPH